jgi:hypothetical protein
LALRPSSFFFTAIAHGMDARERARQRQLWRAAAEGLDVPLDVDVRGIPHIGYARKIVHVAIWNDDPKAIANFVGRAAVPRMHVEDAHRLARAKHDYGDLLVTAARYGSDNAVQFLLQAKVSVNYRNVLSSTLLMDATGHGRTSTIEILLGANADVNAAAESGLTAASIAACEGDVDIIHLLIAAKADVHCPNAETGVKPVSYAVSKGHVAAVRLLGKDGMDLADQFTFAVVRGDADAVQRLIETKADADGSDCWGNHLLCRVARACGCSADSAGCKGGCAHARRLQQYGVDVRRDGRTCVSCSSAARAPWCRGVIGSCFSV